MTTYRGLYFLERRSHSQPRHAPEDYLIAPVASSSSTEVPPDYPVPQGDVSTSMDRSATTDKLWHRDYRPHTYMRGNRRSGLGDYWVCTSGGKHAI